ncbi:L-asparaginase-like 1 [Homarus americanus]|uniref:asparaginase n=1 Tax=Homarus americanus TaxID=6706 RepID=A0A8J5N916_HOMAM|nr:L-asparaginase-like 1 [Homarus americanus]
MNRRKSSTSSLDEISASYDVPVIDPTSVPKVLAGTYTPGTGDQHPDCKEKRRVVYWVYEYDPLLDSSNMTMDDWIRIAKDIRGVYEMFDGFVVLHGTDTLAYTASALSFMLENLGKPVVITGSQIPIFETRSDGRDNFIGSVIMAGSYTIPEVSVFFNNKLYRGNRTTKVSTGRLQAFDSPNMSPLAIAGISIQVDYRSVFRPTCLEKFTVFDRLNRHVGILRIFPSISAETVCSFLQPPMAGAVIQTYGAGNMPSNRSDIVKVLKEATQRGVILVNITQCMHGSVDTIYETGEMMTKNLRGEMTAVNQEDEGESRELDIVSSIARALQLSSSDDVEHVKELLIPTMFFSAIANADISRLEEIYQNGIEINLQDASGWTALHMACNEGILEIVVWLLQHGASVHIRDKLGRSPLSVAIENDHHKIIELLVKTGAHVIESPVRLGDVLVAAAAAGNSKRLLTYHLADVDLSYSDPCGRSALHAACTVGSEECVQVLLDADVPTDVRDRTDLTAVMCAQINNNQHLVDLIATHEERIEEVRRSMNYSGMELPRGKDAACTITGGPSSPHVDLQHCV